MFLESTFARRGQVGGRLIVRKQGSNCKSGIKLTIVVKLIMDPFPVESQEKLRNHCANKLTSLCSCYHLESTVRKRGGPGLADVFNLCTSLNRLKKRRAWVIGCDDI